jgi:hypothetical protein
MRNLFNVKFYRSKVFWLLYVVQGNEITVLQRGAKHRKSKKERANEKLIFEQRDQLIQK